MTAIRPMKVNKGMILSRILKAEEPNDSLLPMLQGHKDTVNGKLGKGQ